MNNLCDDILNLVFSYLSVRDLCNCCRTSRRWRDILGTRSYLWKQNLLAHTPDKFHNDPLLQDLDTAKDKLIAYYCSWSEEDHSKNVYVMPNKLTVHRNPVAQSSDLIRGKKGFSNGLHYWTVVWHGPKFGSSAVVGVATKQADVIRKGYCPLLGIDRESWGWDLSERVLRHDGQSLGQYPESKNIRVEIKLTIGVTLDMCNRTLGFDIEGKYLGIAFRDLPAIDLFPAVSSVFGNTEVSMLYHGSPFVG